MIDWHIEGIEFGACNCDYGCPCQFEADPTYGNCYGFEVIRIERGHFGDVSLTGLNVAMLYGHAGLMSEGNGHLQVIIDTRADAGQSFALEQILHGKETEEAATHWWVYCSLSSVIHPTLYKPIEFDMDIDARQARVSIPDVLHSTGRPIYSDHNGQEHRVSINIADGIEFTSAEMGSASAKTRAQAAISFDIEDKYGQFNHIKHSGTGIVNA